MQKSVIAGLAAVHSSPSSNTPAALRCRVLPSHSSGSCAPTGPVTMPVQPKGPMQGTQVVVLAKRFKQMQKDSDIRGVVGGAYGGGSRGISLIEGTRK